MKSTITAVAAVAALAFAAAPASAQDPLAKQLEASASGVQNDVNGESHIEINCTALATPNALATGIKECYLRGANGSRYNASDPGALIGPAAARATAVLRLPVQRYDACVVAHAYYQDSTYLVSDVECYPVYWGPIQ